MVVGGLVGGCICAVFSPALGRLRVDGECSVCSFPVDGECSMCSVPVDGECSVCSFPVDGECSVCSFPRRLLMTPTTW